MRGSRRCPAGSAVDKPRTAPSRATLDALATCAHTRGNRERCSCSGRFCPRGGSGLGAPLVDARLLVAHLGALGVGEKLRGVDADRIVAHPHRATLEEHSPFAHVNRETEVLLTRHQKVAHVAASLEAENVGSKKPVYD